MQSSSHPAQTRPLVYALQQNIRRVIVGKDESLIRILLAIIAGGHILMEDIPGVGKTTMAISVSRALGLDYNRVQFTPDVLQYLFKHIAD